MGTFKRDFYELRYFLIIISTIEKRLLLKFFALLVCIALDKIEFEEIKFTKKFLDKFPNYA